MTALRGGGELSETQWSRAAQQRVAALAEMRQVHEAFEWFRRREPSFQEQQVEVASIPAPPFGENVRGDWLRRRFESLKLSDIHVDAIGNVLGILPGAEEGAGYVLVSAHIDTVFPIGTRIEITRSLDRLHGPGVSDNAAGIVALLGIAGALRATGLRNHAPILFVGNVGEEGEGDLRGMRHIFASDRWRDSIESSVIVDGAGTDSIITEGLGSRRFKVTVRGPGGHSWSDFGVPNPVISLARIISEFSAVELPASPKTTFNIGVIEGGTSVNAIPEQASMRVDLRSVSVDTIDMLEEKLRETVRFVIPPGGADITAEISMIGDRPAAELRSDSPLLTLVRAVDAHLGITARIQRASTDANIPLSLGREAVTLGSGGFGAGAHTLHEWFDPTGRDLALKRLLLLVLALTGVAE